MQNEVISRLSATNSFLVWKFLTNDVRTYILVTWKTYCSGYNRYLIINGKPLQPICSFIIPKKIYCELYILYICTFVQYTFDDVPNTLMYTIYVFIYQTILCTHDEIEISENHSLFTVNRPINMDMLLSENFVGKLYIKVSLEKIFWQTK